MELPLLPLFNHLLWSPLLPHLYTMVPGTKSKALSSLVWGFIFKKKAKHIFNSHNQMERALLRQHKGNKTEQADVANPVKDPGALCQLSLTLKNTSVVWEANNPGQYFPEFFCTETTDQSLHLSSS